jgi:hypothetical protein
MAKRALIHRLFGALAFIAVIVTAGAIHVMLLNAWRTADPPIAMSDGTTRSHTAGEIASAQTTAVAAASVAFVGAVVTIGALAAWFLMIRRWDARHREKQPNHPPA